MLENLQAWLRGNQQTDFLLEDRRILRKWAKQQGAQCLPVKSPQAGWVVEWPMGEMRLEWGNSRRRYIAGNELRWIVPCHLHANTEMVVLHQSFAKRIGAECFGDLTADNHTNLESALPDEVRWITMLPAYSFFDDAESSGLVCHSQDRTWRDVWSHPLILNAFREASDTWWLSGTAATLSCYRDCMVLRLEASHLTTTELNQIKTFLDTVKTTISECKP